jgi:hypothetical protein
MKTIFNCEHLLPNKVYYNFDFQNDLKSKFVRGAQIILEGNRDYRIEDINELSINLEEVVKGKSYKLQLSIVTPYNPDWKFEESLRDGYFFSGITLLGYPEYFSYYQDDIKLSPDSEVYKFYLGKTGFKLKISKNFRLIHDKNYYHVISIVDIIKNI